MEINDIAHDDEGSIFLTQSTKIEKFNFGDESKNCNYESEKSIFTDLVVSNQKKLVFCGNQFSTIQCFSTDELKKETPLGKTENLT
jgi:WD40 repeat protein